MKAAGTFLVVLGTIALLLASLGLYAITAYAVGCRTREIGIRMALGAQGSDVCSAILGHGLRLTLVGISLGCVASLALAPLISGFLYGVNSRDPVAHFAVSGLLCVVSLAGTVLPAVSATRVDPIVTLRGD